MYRETRNRRTSANCKIAVLVMLACLSVAAGCCGLSKVQSGDAARQATVRVDAKEECTPLDEQGRTTCDSPVTPGMTWLTAHGVAIYRAVRDGMGRVLEESYWTADGRPARGGDGYWKMTRTREADGNTIEEAWFGVDGRPWQGDYNDGARVTAEYDKNHNLTAASIFGIDGRLKVGMNGYARITREYDEKGQLVRELWFGANGEPIEVKKGQTIY